jgi:hypothetical protein
MKKRRIEIKILPETYRLLRMVAALQDERQYQVLHRLVQAEADRVLTETLAPPEPVERQRAGEGPPPPRDWALALFFCS